MKKAPAGQSGDVIPLPTELQKLKDQREAAKARIAELFYMTDAMVKVTRTQIAEIHNELDKLTDDLGL